MENFDYIFLICIKKKKNKELWKINNFQLNYEYYNVWYNNVWTLINTLKDKQKERIVNNTLKRWWKRERRENRRIRIVMDDLWCLYENEMLHLIHEEFVWGGIESGGFFLF